MRTNTAAQLRVENSQQHALCTLRQSESCECICVYENKSIRLVFVICPVVKSHGQLEAPGSEIPWFPFLPFCPVLHQSLPASVCPAALFSSNSSRLGVRRLEPGLRPPYIQMQHKYTEGPAAAAAAGRMEFCPRQKRETCCQDYCNNQVAIMAWAGTSESLWDYCSGSGGWMHPGGGSRKRWLEEICHLLRFCRVPWAEDHLIIRVFGCSMGKMATGAFSFS